MAHRQRDCPGWAEPESFEYLSDYQTFLDRKRIACVPTGITKEIKTHPSLFAFQRDIVRWACRRGRACIFSGCGTGKTRMSLEWAKNIGEPTLVLAPLAVANQTVDEGKAIDIPVKYCRDQSEIGDAQIVITNYQMMDKFDPSLFRAVVLDESSIIKRMDGAFRNQIIASFKHTPFKLACTATPSPNDFVELGNHAEFMGAMTRTEMLSTFFVHDGGETQKWRLKGHAESEFWKWVCSWAVVLQKPSDLGYEDDGFILPELRMHEIIVSSPPSHEFLFPLEAQSLQERIGSRRESITPRAEKCAEIVNNSDEAWIIWCGLNTEAELVSKLINGVEVRGSHTLEEKLSAIVGFLDGSIKRLISKSSIFGFGLNVQICHNVVFLGISDSFESYFQAVRRCWRFGQKHPVNVYIIISETEGSVLANIKRKEVDANRMFNAMVHNMHEINEQNIKSIERTSDEYKTGCAISDSGKWEMNLEDCVEGVLKMESRSVGFSVFSPPFHSLFTYSNSDRDMGNCKNVAEFTAHFGFLIRELGRVTMPGRLVAVHCFDVPSMKERDGVIGLKDFSNEIRIAFESQGFIYHSRVTIWKDPVTQMQRTKALGLLHKTIRKDSAMSRQGLPDYLIVMRKEGINPEPVSHTHDQFPVSQWQQWASPVWMDINPSDTLQYRSAREHKDERHIAPLQLEVIRRAIMLWSNPGDLVLSPFAGIGSEGVVAVKHGRRFIGFELKLSYWNQAVANLKIIESEITSESLFKESTL